jgi:hypothetical protein
MGLNGMPKTEGSRRDTETRRQTQRRQKLDVNFIRVHLILIRG